MSAEDLTLAVQLKDGVIHRARQDDHRFDSGTSPSPSFRHPIIHDGCCDGSLNSILQEIRVVGAMQCAVHNPTVR
jgi:hypothetical protein